MVGELAASLFHPTFVGTGRASGEMNTASLEFHDKEQIESDQSVPGPDFDRSKIDRSQNVRGTVQVSRQK